MADSSQPPIEPQSRRFAEFLEASPPGVEETVSGFALPIQGGGSRGVLLRQRFSCTALPQCAMESGCSNLPVAPS